MTAIENHDATGAASAAAVANGLAAARASAARYRDWIVAKALPLWSTVGFDAGRGMFQERLDWSGAPQETAARRAMVQCRQIYVFSHAAHLGWFPEGGRLAEIAMNSLLGKFCEDRDPSGGFAFSVNAEGRVVSSVRDAYSHAFVLFAIAWLHRLNGDPRLIDYADRVIAFIDARLQDPVNGGLYDSAPVADRSKRQNPHMHLLEASIALEIAAPGRGYLERAKKLIEIFKTRLFLADPGVLLEYFAEDWSSHPDMLKRRIFEPGHHFEWVWLLREYEKLSGDDLSPWIRQLDGVARRNGIAKSGLIFDELSADMSVLRRSHRIWPHTEAAKAAVATRCGGESAAAQFAAAMLDALAEKFLDKPFAGGWIDHVSAEGVPLVDFAPASSLYHLFLAAAETSHAFPPGSGGERVFDAK
ncbi:AGE family epimerase/isomerase [Methylocella sp.]|jgi:mannose-6-phosphate isomerase|uniref:AGE family epimerase/isomerase n=1 Tax=Methylocella sp. TaxID=1978226 RepID=UPI003C20E0B0